MTDHLKPEDLEQDAQASSYNSYYGTPRVFSLAEGDTPTYGPRNARVLIFSQRNIERPVWHGGMYEFEDVIMSIDDARMIAPNRQSRTRDDRSMTHRRARTN